MGLPCYECAYRKSIPGDAHSQCVFKWTDSEHRSPRGDSHGIRNGWYMFPINFDPTWGPDECPAFSETADPGMVREGDGIDNLLSILGTRR